MWHKIMNDWRVQMFVTYFVQVKPSLVLRMVVVCMGKSKLHPRMTQLGLIIDYKPMNAVTLAFLPLDMMTCVLSVVN